MSGSVNQVTLVGNLCGDVEVRSFQNGRQVANMRIATNEVWKDKSGERKERAEFHSVAIFSEGLVKVASQYLRKGSKVFVQGKLATRKWTAQDGSDRYTTEVVLQGFDAKLVMLDGPQGDQRGERKQPYEDRLGEFAEHRRSEPNFSSDIDDEVPF